MFAMKTERKELTLCVPDQQGGSTSANLHVLRMIEDNGEEKTWVMRGFLNDMFHSLHFKTEEEYMEHVKEWDWAFIFPEWNEICRPGVGAYLSPLSDELAPNEIYQWLYDILFEMRLHLDDAEMVEKVQVETTETMPDDPIPLPPMTVGILLDKPQQLLEVLYAPEVLDFEDPIEGLKNSMGAYMSLGHERVPMSVSVPVIWNLTLNHPNAFRRGDLCKVRFVNGLIGGRHMSDYLHNMPTWESMPFNDIWTLWD